VVDSKRTREWLENVKELEDEIRALNSETERLVDKIGSKIYLKPRGIPNPDRVGGMASCISKPTEDSALDLMCDNSSEELNEIIRQINQKKDEINFIKLETKLIYNELKKKRNKKDRMKAVWYLTICLFYFKHMSICEISAQTHFGESTVKTHKRKGIEALATMLDKNMS